MIGVPDLISLLEYVDAAYREAYKIDRGKFRMFKFVTWLVIGI